MVKEKELPINNKQIDKIKTINHKYFYGKGEWLSGFHQLVLVYQ